MLWLVDGNLQGTWVFTVQAYYYNEAFSYMLDGNVHYFLFALYESHSPLIYRLKLSLTVSILLWKA